MHSRLGLYTSSVSIRFLDLSRLYLDCSKDISRLGCRAFLGTPKNELGVRLVECSEQGPSRGTVCSEKVGGV